MNCDCVAVSHPHCDTQFFLDEREYPMNPRRQAILLLADSDLPDDYFYYLVDADA
jgi:hypothetical protein